MFTGIVEEMGIVQGIQKKQEALELIIQGKKVLEDADLGDSIAVNGVCLTVTKIHQSSLSFDVMPETFRATNLHELGSNSPVNLERSMGANGRFGGHFVTGHVDGIGTILDKRAEQNAIYYDIAVPSDILPYIMFKGSIAIDGTSLTVFGVNDEKITISLIPHTVSYTVLGKKGKGDHVNLEGDMLGKYVSHFIGNGKGKEKNKDISLDFLQEHGF
ncbi:riboflavin synthase [Bacillaceae bacterium S4-13-58]